MKSNLFLHHLHQSTNSLLTAEYLRIQNIHLFLFAVPCTQVPRPHVRVLQPKARCGALQGGLQHLQQRQVASLFNLRHKVAFILYARLGPREQLCNGAENGKVYSTVLLLQTILRYISVTLKKKKKRFEFMCMGPNILLCLQEGQMTLPPDDKNIYVSKWKVCSIKSLNIN